MISRLDVRDSLSLTDATLSIAYWLDKPLSTSSYGNIVSSNLPPHPASKSNDDIICDRPYSVAPSPGLLYRVCGWHSILHILKISLIPRVITENLSRDQFADSKKNDLGHLSTIYLARGQRRNSSPHVDAAQIEKAAWWTTEGVGNGQFQMVGQISFPPHIHLSMIKKNALKIMSSSEYWLFLTKITETTAFINIFVSEKVLKTAC